MSVSHTPDDSGSVSYAQRTGWGLEYLRELLASVNSLSLSVEVLLSHPVGVVVAAVGVALASKAILRVCTAAVVFLADMVCILSTRVGRQCE